MKSICSFTYNEIHLVENHGRKINLAVRNNTYNEIHLVENQGRKIYLAVRSLLAMRVLLLVLLLGSISCLSAVSVFFSDCQSNNLTHAKVVQQILQYSPDNVFIGGDITLNGSRQAEYADYHRVMQPLETIASIYPTMGNHDRDFQLFLSNFPTVDSLGYYSVDKDGVVWIILNSSLKLAPGSTQHKWLKQTLEANMTRTMIVMLHHPVFSSGAHGDEKGYSFLLPDLLSQYPVAAVLSGHDHIYERSVKDSINYVVFGGAGGNLYNSEGKNDFAVIFRKTHGFLLFTPQNDIMKVNAIDIDGKPIEEFSFPILQQAGR